MAEKYPFAGGGGPQEEPSMDVLGQLGTYLQDPNIGAAILNAGVQIAGGGGTWGETPMSRLMGGVAAGGEAIRSREALGQKERELASKEDARGAAAQLAEARAATTGAGSTAKEARAETALKKLELEREKFGYTKERDATRQAAGDRDSYFDHQRATIEMNKKADLLGGKQEPLLSFEEWMARGKPGSGATPSAAATAGADKPIPLPRTPDGKVDTGKLVKGQTYDTAKGVGKYNGAGGFN